MQSACVDLIQPFANSSSNRQNVMTDEEAEFIGSIPVIIYSFGPFLELLQFEHIVKYMKIDY